ncbi:MAG: inorganic phosphate transporter [Kiloniellaceae bacterium]
MLGPRGPRKIVRFAPAAQDLGRGFTGLALGGVFLAAVWGFAALQTGDSPKGVFIVLAGIVGGYMALNIGANDVANNVGPAVGCRALTMVGALVIAAVFEALGAIVAGGDVVATISKGIIDPSLIAETDIFIAAMLAALLASALWINLATYIGAPVSTTHAVVGGVMGAGIAAAGIGVVDGGTMAKIAASWVISPVLGGVVAALFLGFVKFAIIDREDQIAAAGRWVPILVALMAGVFSAYLIMKGLKRVWTPDKWLVALLALAVFAGAYAVLKPLVARRAQGMEDPDRSLHGLFIIPLICSAALLSFAHGSNDVANAVGPLSAIVGAAHSGGVTAKVGIPPWVMIIGAVGISAGLILYGPKLIRTVGEEITRLNPIRAYCAVLSAAITVIAASALGLPVSSTHIAVGAVFGVGFFREYFANRRALRTAGSSRWNPEAATGKNPKSASGNGPRRPRRKLVRRAHLITILAAWVVTVPVTAVMAGGLFLMVRTFLSV